MLYILLLTALIIFTIFSGAYFSRNPSKVRKLAKKFLVGNVVAFIILLVIAFLLIPSSQAYAAQGTANTPVNTVNDNSKGLGFIGMALSTGLAAIGAGIAVGIVGAASVGAISEKPELFGRTLIYVGLAEGIAIYGLIMSIMILGKV